MNLNTRFFSRILLPSMVAVLIFLVAIYLFVIPNYRDSLMDKKRETIRELTNVAWSVMHKLDLMVDADFSLQMAQKEAALIIGDMRWGDELKDYFWITDTLPRMVMHPYRPSLNEMDLSDYEDLGGKKLFVEMVDVVHKHGYGYVDYKWQWKDDSTKVVPKLSYVKEFEPWGWIVGTGIYIEDVKTEITRITSSLLWISILITILIGAFITYLARRNYVAERERQLAQERLRDSMERYKKLVEASTDGVLMMIGNEIAYCNPYLLNLLGYSQEEFDQKDPLFFETLSSFIEFDTKDDGQVAGTEHPEISTEQKVKKKNGVMVDVVVNRSTFEIEGKQGVIYAVKDVSKHKDVERELDLSMEKFKSIAGLMNLGIFRCTLGRQSRFIEMNPKALELLGYASQSELRDTHVQELFDVNEERKEVVRAINEGIHIKDRLIRLKRADGTILPALVSLFPVNDAHGKTVYCDGIIIDAYDHLTRDISFEKSSSANQLTANILLQPIKDFLLPAPHCDMDTTVIAAAKLLTKVKADILLVKGDDASILGLVTHRDISRRVVAQGGDSSIRVSEIMSAPVISVSDEDMVMDAFSLMVQHRISYVVVKSKDTEKPSYISLLKLSQLRKDTPEYIVNSIQSSASVYEINSEMERLPYIIRNLVESGTGASTTGKLISKISDTISEKLISDAMADIGEPPVPFVFLALGSEGRREQTLATDQDNAIVFKSLGKEKDAHNREYFLKLGSKVCNLLNMAGYPLCKGGVMAMNEEWCMSFDSWQKTITGWVNIPNPQEILNISIFFDFRPVYGDFELANEMHKFCRILLKDKSVFFYNLAQSTINLKLPAIDSFKEKDEYDIKLPILAITSIVRLWSLKYGVGERNTIERMFALETASIFTSELRNELEQGYRFLMLMRIKNQLRQFEHNLDVSNYINPKILSEIEKLTLKKVINTITNQQNRLAMEFRVG
ncbi:MAG: DUF294 nucleotidyltransferase-like domain-containing protein [Bacteroidales bacterium]